MKSFCIFIIVIFLFSCQKKLNDAIPPLPSKSESQLKVRIKYLQQQLAEHPDNEQILYNLSKYYLQNNEIDKAFQSISKAINQGNKSKKNLLLLTETLYKKELYEDAFAVLEQISINDFSEDEYSLFASDIFIKAKEYAKAEILINKIITKDPNNSEALTQYTQLLLIKKDTISAIQNLEKSLSIDSTNPQIIAQISDLYFNQKLFKKSIINSKKALKLDSTLTNQTERIIYCMDKLGQKDSIFYYSNIYLKQDSTNININSFLCNKAFEAKKYKQTLRLLKLIENSKILTDEENYMYGVCLVYDGKHEESKSYFIKVSQESFRFKNSQYYLNKFRKS